MPCIKEVFMQADKIRDEGRHGCHFFHSTFIPPFLTHYSLSFPLSLFSFFFFFSSSSSSGTSSSLPLLLAILLYLFPILQNGLHLRPNQSSFDRSQIPLLHFSQFHRRSPQSHALSASSLPNTSNWRQWSWQNHSSASALGKASRTNCYNLHWWPRPFQRRIRGCNIPWPRVGFESNRQNGYWS